MYAALLTHVFPKEVYDEVRELLMKRMEGSLQSLIKDMYHFSYFITLSWFITLIFHYTLKLYKF